MTPLRYYWSIFLKRFAYFMLVMTVIFATSVAIAITLPAAYVSEMKLVVESPQIPDDLASSTASTPAQEQLQLIEQRLLTRANLLEIANQLQVFGDQSIMLPDQIERAMRARTILRTGAERRGQIPIMYISFEASTGQKAAAVLNEYLNLILQEDVQSRTGRAALTLDFFEQEVARLNLKLAEGSARILDFKTEHADALPESLEYRLNRQSILQERLAQLEREIAGLEDQRNRFVQVFESTGRVDSARVSQLTPEQQKLETLRAQLNEALAVYSAENPKVKILKAQIAQVESVVGTQSNQTETPESSENPLLEVQLAEIDSRRNSLEEQKATTQSQLDKLNDSIARTPANAILLGELQLEYQNNQNQYNTAVNRLSLASTGERIEVMSRGQRVSVIEPPSIPNSPSKPNRFMIIGGGGFLGILVGFGLVLLLELLNREIRRPEDLVSNLEITPLATIPYIYVKGELAHRKTIRVLRIVLVLLGVPAAIYAVHVFYQPLEVLANRIGIDL